MIQIRAFFKWREATPEQAFEFCNSFMNSIQTTHIKEEKIKIINKNHLRGITYEELKKQVIKCGKKNKIFCRSKGNTTN